MIKVGELQYTCGYTSSEDKVYVRMDGKLYEVKDVNIENSDIVIDV